MANGAEPSAEAAPLRDAIPYAVRLAAYGLGMLAVCQLFSLGVEAYGASWMGTENGPVEAVQVALLCGGAVCFFTAASRSEIGVSGMCPAATVLGYAAARECDTIFERLFFDDAYKWLVGFPMLATAVVVVARRRDRWAADFIWSIRQPATTMFVIGGVLVVTLGQMFDRPGTWGDVATSPSGQLTTVMVEELVELFGYLLLAFAGIEAWIFSRQPTHPGRRVLVSEDRFPLQGGSRKKPENANASDDRQRQVARPNPIDVSYWFL